MYFKRLVTPGLSIYTYLLGDEKTKKCVVIDPTRQVVPIILSAQDAEMDITAIVETHVHADYVSGSKELKHQLNDKPDIYASGMGGENWIPHYADVVVQRGTEIKIGDIRLAAVHTPGHTPEHIIWICYDETRSAADPWFAFTGDALFVGSIGRPDLLGSKELANLGPQLYHTVFDVLALLPEYLEIFPAHGEGSLCGKALRSRGESTIGYEKRYNPCFKNEAQKQWLSSQLKDLPPAPPYFSRMKRINVEGAPYLNSLQTKVWKRGEGPDLKELFLVDIRLPDPFAASHLEGALNIPHTHVFCLWAGWMIPSDRPIGLIVENTHIYTEAVDQLRLMGFDQDIWIIKTHDGQVEGCDSLSKFPMIEVEELAPLLSLSKPIRLVDVRTLDEWNFKHIPEAQHIDLTQLEQQASQLPKDQTIALICRSGQRASLAASLLQKLGFPSVVNVRGGMQAWNRMKMSQK